MSLKGKQGWTYLQILVTQIWSQRKKPYSNKKPQNLTVCNQNSFGKPFAKVSAKVQHEKTTIRNPIQNYKNSVQQPRQLCLSITRSYREAVARLHTLCLSNVWVPCQTHVGVSKSSSLFYFLPNRKTFPTPTGPAKNKCSKKFQYYFSKLNHCNKLSRTSTDNYHKNGDKRLYQFQNYY